MSTASADDRLLTIELAAALGPDQVEWTALRVPAGASVADAVRASGLVERIGAAAIDALTPGIGGRACSTQTALRDGDRIELYRPLAVDPKEARRQRWQRDGMRRSVKP